MSNDGQRLSAAFALSDIIIDRRIVARTAPAPIKPCGFGAPLT
jgi:hypothetical protein